MIKKIVAVIALLLLFIAISACSVERTDSDKQISNEYSYSQKETVIHNYFKEKLPEFDFKNEPVERYRDGESFSLSVTCSQKEFEKYVKKLKNSGFDDGTVEAETYYSANSEDGYFVEATYVGDMLTVFVEKI